MKNRDTTSFGLLLILVAIVFILKSFDLIAPSLSSMLLSWQMLVIAFGFLMLLRKHYFAGVFVLFFGIYCIVPKLLVNFNLVPDWDLSTIRGLLLGIGLLIIGSLIVFGRRYFDSSILNFHDNMHNVKEVKGDKVLNMNTVFGGATHVVFEKPFKGANISNAFSGMKLDLRNTYLEDGDTYVSIKCVFGGIDILVPNEWCVVSEISSIFAGVDDKRDKRVSPKNSQKRLILTGGVIFGGVQLQSECSDYGSFTIYDDVTSTDDSTEVDEVVESITVKHNNKVHIIPIDDLQYIQADGDYVTLCSTQGKFLKEQTMKYFETVLPDDKFIRIHRSYIVKLSEISYVDTKGRETYFVVLKDGTSLRASTNGYQQLKQKLSI